jgi:excisionase family DNA binding protein
MAPVLRFRWPDDPPTLAEVMTAVAEQQAEVAKLRAAIPQQMVDLKAADEHLGVSERTVKRWVKEGRVPFRRVGRTLRFPLAALNPPRAA